MNLELDNKRILVTGASKGIGKAIAKQFLEENARVCLVARGEQTLGDTVSQMAEQFGSEKVISLACDCGDTNSLQQLKSKILCDWGGVDVVVANVGDGRSTSDPIPEDAHWQNTWNTNFNTARLTAGVFLPLLQQSKGNLIFISSIAGTEAIGAPTDYATAKCAVNGLAINLARKVAPDIRINVIAPGNINFPGGSWQAKIEAEPEKIANMLADKVPLNRFGTPEEIADIVTFLSSPRAAFITGSIFTVDGGQTVGGL